MQKPHQNHNDFFSLATTGRSELQQHPWDYEQSVIRRTTMEATKIVILGNLQWDSNPQTWWKDHQRVRDQVEPPRESGHGKAQFPIHPYGLSPCVAVATIAGSFCVDVGLVPPLSPRPDLHIYHRIKIVFFRAYSKLTVLNPKSPKP
jgi:hypothetical protein